MSQDFLTVFFNEFDELTSELEDLATVILSAAPQDASENLDGCFVAIKRHLHTLKGNAGFMDYESLASVIHEFEERLKHQDRPSQELGRDVLRLTELLQQFRSQPDERVERPQWLSAPVSQSPSVGSIVTQQPSAKGRTSSRFERERTDRVTVPLSALNQLLKSAETLRSRCYAGGGRQHTQEVTDLCRQILAIRQVSFRSLALRMQRLVSQLATELGKTVLFQVTGQDIKVDASLVDNLNTALPHILRNALDHGLEKPRERVEKNKQPACSLRLQFALQSGCLKILIEDDGRGIDRERLTQKAVEKGLLSHSEAQLLTHYQKLQLIFREGFSTRSQATKISGRGLGMDIVASKVAERQGEIGIHSEMGRGTRFEIVYSLEVQASEVAYVQVGDHCIGVPLNDIQAIVPADQLPPPEFGAVLYNQQLTPIIGLSELDPLFLAQGPRALIVLKLQGLTLGLPIDRWRGFGTLLTQSCPTQQFPEYFSGLGINEAGELVWLLDIEYLSRHWNAFTVPVNSNPGGEL